MTLLDAGKPLYEAVKDHVRARIDSGEWTAAVRIPSENELGPLLGVSRITVNRAFRELAEEGRLRKVPGVGTFVTEGKPRFGLVSIQSIAEEIAARGMAWSCTVLALETVGAASEQAALLALAPGAAVFHSQVLHKGDGVPIQLEERFVRPDHARDYLRQDFTHATSFAYLRAVADVDEMEQAVTALLPSRALARRLAMPPADPCLVIRRRTFRQGQPTTVSCLTQPASRFELAERVRMHLPARGMG